MAVAKSAVTTMRMVFILSSVVDRQQTEVMSEALRDSFGLLTVECSGIEVDGGRRWLSGMRGPAIALIHIYTHLDASVKWPEAQSHQ
jgi:hypothetical protein